MKKFCSKCGRLYDDSNGQCSCRKKIQKNIKRNYEHDTFYSNVRWKHLSQQIKTRDFYTDRLALYLIKSNLPQKRNEDEKVYKLLHDYLIDVYGQKRRLSDRLICHHIIPREEDASKEYVWNNLITVSNDTHEYIHQLYATGKEQQVQQILHNAVDAMLP